MISSLLFVFFLLINLIEKIYFVLIFNFCCCFFLLIFSLNHFLKNSDKAELKIDFVDIFSERAYALSKGDTYANVYLADKQCYELHKILFNKGKFIFKLNLQLLTINIKIYFISY